MKHPCSHVLTSIGMCFEVGGTIVGVFVYTAYYLGLVTQSDVCEDGRRLPDPNLRAAYRWHALTLGVILLFCISTTVIGVREQKGMYVYRGGWRYACVGEQGGMYV